MTEKSLFVHGSIKLFRARHDTLFLRILSVFALITITAHLIAGALLYFGIHQGWIIYRPAPQLAILVAVLAQLGIVSFCAWFGASRAARPLQWLARATSAMTINVNSPPITVQGPVEARNAAKVLNQLQVEIRRRLDERGRFHAAVSHDLRTPLTRINLRIQRLENDTLRQQLERDVYEMRSLIDSTLLYLRDSESDEQFEAVDVEALVNSITENEQDIGHDVSVIGNAAPILAQPIALKRCITNLVTNAIRYGTSARIELSDRPQQLRISISDEGPGISQEEINLVCQPFYRIESSRNPSSGGFGLGLAIALEIARRHSGELTLRNRVGGGLTAEINMKRPL